MCVCHQPLIAREGLLGLVFRTRFYLFLLEIDHEALTDSLMHPHAGASWGLTVSLSV